MLCVEACIFALVKMQALFSFAFCMEINLCRSNGSCALFYFYRKMVTKMIWIILATLAAAAVTVWISWLVAKEFYVAAKAKGYSDTNTLQLLPL